MTDHLDLLRRTLAAGEGLRAELRLKALYAAPESDRLIRAWCAVREEAKAVLLRAPQTDEAQDLLDRFTLALCGPTGDGAVKRRLNHKPAWYEDDSHEVAMFSHLARWKRGELVDPDSGAHPLVHLAWRALAIACCERGDIPGRVLPLRPPDQEPDAA